MMEGNEMESEGRGKKKNENLFDLNTPGGLLQFMTEPYFKSTVDDGNFTVAPMLEDPTRKTKLPFRMTYVLQRQENKGKEIEAVKSCAISTLREELERKLQDHFESCLSKMDLTETEMQSITTCQTDNQLVDAVVQICVDREISGKLEPSYAPVMCYVKCPDKKFTVLSETKNLYDLLQFKLKCSRDIVQLDLVEFSKTYPIDWLAVSSKMFNLHNRFKTPEECELIWKWNHSPGICRDPFDFKEIEEVMNVLDQIGTQNMWHELPKVMKNGRTVFDYYMMYCSLPKYEMDYKIPKELKKQLVNSYLSYQDFNILAAKLSVVIPQMNSDIARILYLRTLNPMLRRQNFTAIEDAILLVVMELQKDEIIVNGAYENFYHCIMEYMPWRYTDLLRERFESLFQATFYPFTIEEDRLLIAAVDLMGREWGKISQLFNSNKTRKHCSSRYNHISNWTEAQLEHSHLLDSKPHKLSWSSPLMLALCKISQLLLEWEKRDHISPSQFSRVEPPTENELHMYIRSFPRSVVQKTFDKLINYCHLNVEYRAPPPSRLSYDRRKFNKNLPVSWASALHLRRIDLKPMESIENPTDFELAIYAHYNKYGNGKKPKTCIIRYGLPSAKQLAGYPEISRIVAKNEVQPSLSLEPTPPNGLNIKIERIPNFELGKDEEESCCNDSFGCMDYDHQSGRCMIKEEQLKSDGVENVQDIKCGLQKDNDRNEQNDELKTEKARTGPKAKRIRNLRKEAAKARWAKNKGTDANEGSSDETKNIKVDVDVKQSSSSLKMTDAEEESSVETKNIKVDVDVKQSLNSFKPDVKLFKSTIDTKINIKKENLLDVKDIKIDIVSHDHSYCKAT